MLVAHIPLVVRMGISWSCWMATSSLCTVRVVATGSTAFGPERRIVGDIVPRLVCAFAFSICLWMIGCADVLFDPQDLS